MYVDETKKLKVFNISNTSNKQKTNNFLHYSRKFWKFLILKNLSNMMETNETDLCVSGGYRFSRLCTYRGIMTESGTGACHDCHQYGPFSVTRMLEKPAPIPFCCDKVVYGKTKIEIYFLKSDHIERFMVRQQVLHCIRIRLYS